jgi:hypothetical protein
MHYISHCDYVKQLPTAESFLFTKKKQLSHSIAKCNGGERECKHEHPLSSMHFFNCHCSRAHPLSSLRQADAEVIVEPLCAASFVVETQSP